jgi:hypothetical protein
MYFSASMAVASLAIASFLFVAAGSLEIQSLI